MAGKNWVISIFIALLFNILLVYLIPRLNDKVQIIPGKKRPIRFVNIKQNPIKVDQKNSRIKQNSVKPEPKSNLKKQVGKTVNNNDFSLPKLKPPSTQKDSYKILFPLELVSNIPTGIQNIKIPLVENFSIPIVKDIHFINDLDSPLIPLTTISPLYPLGAKRDGVEGWVQIEYMVNQSGQVENIEIINAYPKNTFENCVKRSVAHWRFKPGTVDGLPVKITISQKITFKLNKY